MWSTQWSDLAHEVDRSNLAQAAVWRTAKEFSTVRSFPCQGLFILWQQRMLRTISRKKSYPINVLLWSLRDFLLLWLLLSVENLTSGRDWELKAKNFLHFCFGLNHPLIPMWVASCPWDHQKLPLHTMRTGRFSHKERDGRRNSAHSKKVLWMLCSKQAHLLALRSLTLRSHCLSLIHNIDIWLMVTKLA